MSILERPFCWVYGHQWVRVRGRLICDGCGAVR